MKDPIQIPVQLQGLVHRLGRATRLLRRYYHEAFDLRDTDFYGEVAVKLRLLVYEPAPVPASGSRGKRAARRNMPLLLGLMDHFGIAVPLKTDGTLASQASTSGDEPQQSLREFLRHRWSVVITESAGPVTWTRIDLVKTWADKLGGAHEDWEHPEDLHLILHQGRFVHVNDLPAMANELRRIAGVVLAVADEVLSRLRAPTEPKPEYELRRDPAGRDRGVSRVALPKSGGPPPRE